MPNRRTIFAFLVAPIATPAVFFLSELLTRRAALPKELLSSLVVLSIYTLPFAYAAELVLGLPAWLLFRRYRISSWVAFAGGGFLIGAVMVLILYRENYTILSLNVALAYAVAGLVSALVFRGIISN